MVAVSDNTLSILQAKTSDGDYILARNFAESLKEKFILRIFQEETTSYVFYNQIIPGRELPLNYPNDFKIDPKIDIGRIQNATAEMAISFFGRYLK